ncbi:MAG: hypothetical protein H6645_08185 [Caldilineaceae bacterium]|nr:hypothetical protein [Caldilineaceae bacterium]
MWPKLCRSNFADGAVLDELVSTITGGISENVDQDDNGLDPVAPTNVTTTAYAAPWSA